MLNNKTLNYGAKMNNKEKAVALFMSEKNCAQSVLIANNEKNEHENEMLMNITQVFGGGVLRTGNLCGAVSGALMAIGIKYGNPNDPHGKGRAIELGRLFLKEFTDKNGSINCRELLGHDMSNEEERKKIVELQLRDKVCKKLIENSSDILEKIFMENKV